MHSVPIPQPKEYFGRPPIDPPCRTTFSSSPGDNGDPLYVVLQESVKHLIRCIHESKTEQLPVMLELVRARKSFILRELAYERMFMPDRLPPTLKNMFALDDLFEEHKVIRVYKKLLDQLESAEGDILRKIEDQKGNPFPSDL